MKLWSLSSSRTRQGPPKFYKHINATKALTHVLKHKDIASPTPALFSWLLCGPLSVGGHLNPRCAIFCFISPFKSSSDLMVQRPSTHFTPAVPPLENAFFCGRRLSDDCCVFLLNDGHLRPPPISSLYY